MTWRTAPPDIYTDGTTLPRTLTIGPPREVAKEYDEELHPRNAQGEWTSGGGETRSISSAARQTLASVERTLKGKEVEHVAVVNPATGQVLVRNTTGESYSCSIPRSELSKVNGAVVTHNHPLERGLSMADISLAMTHNALAVRAVTPSGTVYELRRIGAWPKRLLVQYDQDTSGVMENLFQRVARGELTNNDADAAVSHEVLARTAQAFPNQVRYTRSHP